MGILPHIIGSNGRKGYAEDRDEERNTTADDKRNGRLCVDIVDRIDLDKAGQKQYQ